MFVSLTMRQSTETKIKNCGVIFFKDYWVQHCHTKLFFFSYNIEYGWEGSYVYSSKKDQNALKQYIAVWYVGCNKQINA